MFYDSRFVLSGKDVLFVPGISHPGHISYPSVTAEKVQTGQSHQRINHPGKPGHISKEKIDQIKAREPDQSPIDRSDDHQSKRWIIAKF